MYSFKHRIKEKKVIDKLYKEKGIRGSFFIVKSLEGRFNRPRFVIVVSKKVSPKAVIRNRIKRKMTEILRLNTENFLARDILIIVSPAALELTYNELEMKLLDVFKKTGILNEKNSD